MRRTVELTYGQCISHCLHGTIDVQKRSLPRRRGGGSSGSYAATYVPQGANRAFAHGIDRQVPLTDESFFSALADAASTGIGVRLLRQRLPFMSRAQAAATAPTAP